MHPSARRRLAALLLVPLLALTACTSDPTEPVATGSPAPTGATPSASSTPTPSPTQSPRTDPLAEGPFEVAAGAYDLGDVRPPGLRGEVEMQGVVVGPADAPGKRPLVVLLHGMFAACFSPKSSSFIWPCRKPERPSPSAEGLRYIQDRLASQGYVTVSLRANGVSAYTQATPDAGAGARGWLVRRHLDAWAAGDLPGAERWAQVADPQKVLLVGHSRGGEAVDRAARDRPADAEWRVAGQVLVAPSAWTHDGRTVVPTVTLSGYCDGDTGNAPAQWFVERPAAGDVLRTSILLMGANHTWFNTQWTSGPAVPRPGDDAEYENGTIEPLCEQAHPTRLKAAEQQLVARNVVALAAAGWLAGDADALAALDGSAEPAFAGRGAVHAAALGGGRATVSPAAGGQLVSSAPVRATVCRGVSETEKARDCGGRYGEGRAVHWPAVAHGVRGPDAVQASWSEAGGSFGLQLDEPLDLTGTRGLEARVVVHPDAGPVELDMRLTDGAGTTAVLPSGAALTPFAGTVTPGRLLALRLAVDPSEAALELADVVRVELVARSPRGQVWLLDVSAVPAAVPAAG